MNLSEVGTGNFVFIDANIFLYHFAGFSEQCKEFLKRCESRDLFGVTSVTVLAEVCHQLMLAEAIKRKLISSSRPSRQLAQKPQIVKKLSEYSGHLSNITEWGIEVVDMDKKIFINSQSIRSQFGLLTNDSFIPGYMELSNTNMLATADKIFNRIAAIRVYSPADI